MVGRSVLLALILTACAPRTILVPVISELPPPPPRVYGEPLTDAEYKFMLKNADVILKKFEAGIRLHIEREEKLEVMVCKTRPPPCP